MMHDDLRLARVTALAEKLRCASKVPDEDSPDPPCKSCRYTGADSIVPGEYWCDGDLIMRDAADLLEKQTEGDCSAARGARPEDRAEEMTNRVQIGHAKGMSGLRPGHCHRKKGA